MAEGESAMTDLTYAFTLYFATLGPLKTIPAFYLTTHQADRRTRVTLAAKSTFLATAIVLFVALVASGVMVTWRVSVDAMAIAGGAVLLIASINTLSGFNVTDRPPDTTTVPTAMLNTSWMGRPVLSPLVIPAIVPPVGVVVILFFAGTAIGDGAVQAQLISLLLAIMAANFVAMICAGPIMRLVGVPVLQVVGWVFSALQAGLAVQAIINSVQAMQ
jgi:multiple antibiotic resistance protein